MKKRVGRAFAIAGIVVVVLIGVMLIVASIGMRGVRALTVNPVDLSQVPDGTFHGSYTRGRFSYTVDVSVKDYRIVAIQPSDPRKADAVVRAIIDRVISEQKVNVDTVSGASLTTKAFTKAVEVALAGSQPAPEQ